jgi:heat shock protein HtpX
MLNIYEQVTKNKIRSGIIVSFFTAFIIGVALIVTNTYNLDNSLLVFAFILSLGSSFASYFWGDKIVLTLNQARPATRKEFFDFYTVVENLSIANQTPVPKIYIIETDAMNAFATGRDPSHAVVCATTGLLEKLNRTEIEGVVAHELSHIKNYDILLMTIVSILIGSLSIIINMAYRSSFFRKNDDRENNQAGTIIALLGFVLIIFAPIIAQLIQLAISRRREYFADASAVKLTRQPQGLISALTKISQDNVIFDTASTATASLYITNPFKGNKIASLFSTHPPVGDRIKALQQML